jgi:hypothetical protein
MTWQQVRLSGLCFAAVVCLVVTTARAQQGNGIVVDADGVLRTRVFYDPTGALTRQRFDAARATLAPDMLRPSKMRKVSLTRLEAAAAERLATGQGLPDEMRYLAGLTRIQHVFLYPETGDLVIAGPAEGFAPNIAGRVVGMNTGRAVLELQDLVVAMRAFPPGERGTAALVCSIDPSPEGLQRMQQFLIGIAGRVTPGDAGRIAAGLKENLGLQSVRIEGISARTHFAQVMVEADYRMKLIGIGLEEPPVRIPSYVSRANPQDVSRNALQRWYFTPNYECLRVSEDELAVALEGNGVQLVGEHQLVEAAGNRVASGRVDPASQAFTKAFTQKYAELAAKEPVYAQLRNLIDMAIAAAFIQQHDYYGRIGWEMPLFGSEERFPVETYPEPKQVESAVNVVWKGNTLMTPIGGGVQIEPALALSEGALLKDEQGNVAKLRQDIDIQQIDQATWWWD